MNMSRRGFVGAAGAFAGLALAPAWGTFQQQRREIDLQQFCEDDCYGRYDLTKPFAQGGNVIGMNAHVLVRTTLADAPELDDERHLPNIEKLIDWNKQPDKWLKWPRETYVGTKQKYGYICPFCQGKGGTGNVRQCGTCGGDGHAWLDAADPNEFSSYEAPCPTCKKCGWLWDSKCSHCDGKGGSKTACYQPLSKILIASHYDAMLRGLGDLEYCLHGENRIVRFRGDGFDGLLMPLTVTHEEVDWRRGVLA